MIGGIRRAERAEIEVRRKSRSFAGAQDDNQDIFFYKLLDHFRGGDEAVSLGELGDDLLQRLGRCLAIAAFFLRDAVVNARGHTFA